MVSPSPSGESTVSGGGWTFWVLNPPFCVNDNSTDLDSEPRTQNGPYNLCAVSPPSTISTWPVE